MDKAIRARVERHAWFYRHPRAWPLLLCLVTLLLTALTVLAVEWSERQRAEIELDRNLTEVASALQWRLSENVALLRAGSALFATREGVTNAEFNTFAADLHANGNYFGSMGLGWAPMIPRLDSPSFEVAMRESGRDQFLIHPRPQANEPFAVPVTYIEPMSDANSTAVGFNMYSEQVRREAMDEAARTGRPIATGPVTLYQDRDNPDNVGFLLYLAVFSEGPGPRVAKGFVYSPFRASDFLASVVKLSRERPIEIALFDGDGTDSAMLALGNASAQSGKSLSRVIPVGGRQWTLKVSTRQSTNLTVLSRATLVFGVILSLVLMYVGYMIVKRATEDRAILELHSRQSAIRDSLTRELNHRVKNTLANVLSIVALTRRRSSGIDDFSESLTARIRALGATHDLLSQSNWTSASLGDVIRSELAPYMEIDGSSHVALDGPLIDLAPNDALSLGLAIHELATNAAKYGALSCPDGRIAVSWERAGEDRAQVSWSERGGPPVAEPTRRGFGRDLIEKIVAHELKSQVDLRFPVEGVECRFLVPIRQTSEFSLRRPRGG